MFLARRKTLGGFYTEKAGLARHPDHGIHSNGEDMADNTTDTKQREPSNRTGQGMHGDNEPKAKRAAKASVFTSLFSEMEYTYQLYRALHPDDTVTAKEDLELMTLESHLVNQQYNDLGFLVGERLIILVEAQSTWSENIVVRVLLYVVQTWYKYIKQRKLDIYGAEKIRLPEPELYFIYTGEDAGKKPDRLSLREGFYDGRPISVECEVRVLSGGRKGDIISQYVRFCHVFNEQVRLHGRTRKAVEETIRICRDEKVLAEYLERQWEEVIDIMMALFDQETIMRNHDASVEKRGQQNVAKLMNYLLTNDRSEDAIRATQDEEYLNRLLAEYVNS